MCKEGMRVGKKIYPWAKIAKLSLSNGVLNIAKKDGSGFSGALVAGVNIPNLSVWLSIIAQVIGISTD